MKYKWLCLPKQPTATKGFLCMKVFLLIVFTIIFWFQVVHTVYFLKLYRNRVDDIKVSSVWPSRSEIQVESTHAHFFLFTGLLNGAAILIGSWGILMEYLIILAGYCYIHSVVVGFEVIGAWQSNDWDVAKRKGVGILAEIPLILLALFFAHMVRESEKRLAHSPLYKKKMAERAGKGETMSDPNYQLPSEKKMKGKEIDIEAGQDNLALERDEEDTGNVPGGTMNNDATNPTPSTSGTSSRSMSMASATSGADDVVTVLTSEGKTRISVKGDVAVKIPMQVNAVVEDSTRKESKSDEKPKMDDDDDAEWYL